jgi:ATP-dependent DNA helicase RecG
MLDIEEVKSLIIKGEGLRIEFKTAREELPRNVYETICAFLNRKGGDILLGVRDNGTIDGIDKNVVQNQLRTLSNDLNNTQIISPVIRIEAKDVEIDGKKIIYIHVPESAQAHSYRGVYYDRNHEGDYRLGNQFLITNLFIRKYENHTENKVFPHLRMDDFVKEDFDFVRKRVALLNDKHPWINMSNEDILRYAKMYLRDERTGKEGYTLAAAVVFGKRNALAMACPNYKTDALCRKEDTNRYDDRDIIDCNLIQAYGRLMSFVRKHTPDRFFMEEDRRISLREIIFREAVVNLLIHREFTHPYPARLTIYKETVVTENWNIPHTMGRITPENLTPYPKNPNIAGFFRELDWFEDLGSGVRNMFHYCPLYAKDKNALPIMEEDDVFKLTVRYEKENINTRRVDVKYEDEILILIQENPKIIMREISEKLSINKRTVERIMSKLVNEKRIKREGAKKNGKWVILKMSV